MRAPRRIALVLCTALLVALVPTSSSPAQGQALGIITGVQGSSGTVSDGSGEVYLGLNCFFICVGIMDAAGGFSMLDRISIVGFFIGTAQGKVAGEPVNLSGTLIYLAMVAEPFPLYFPAATSAKATILDETVGTFTVDLQYVITVLGDGSEYRGPLNLARTNPADFTLRPFTVTRI